VEKGNWPPDIFSEEKDMIFMWVDKTREEIFKFSKINNNNAFNINVYKIDIYNI